MISGQPAELPAWEPVVQRLATVGSTNAEALAAARRGAPEGLVVVADHQSAGRGRRGRRWEAPPGSSLLASVVLRPSRPALVPLVAGLAVVEGCARAAELRSGLKWPNDVVVAEGKLGGLLTEAVAGAVVVGLGMNVCWEQPLPPGAVDLLSLTGRLVDREALLDAFLDSLGRLRVLPPGEVLNRYRRACVTLGREVRVHTPAGELEGRAVDVDPGGALVVEETGGIRRTVVAGDVVHLRPSVSGS